MSKRAPRNAKPDQRSRPGRSRAPAPAEVPWSVPVPVAEIPQTGRRFELTADAATREAVAKAADVVALLRLQAVFDLTPFGKDGVRVAGHVSATVEQSCVVTLEPVISEVEEPIDLTFVSAEKSTSPQEAPTLDVSEENDLPEVLHNGVLILGALASEFLILGLNPYPRSPGATFQSPQPRRDPADHPFAALAGLKKNPGEKPQ